MQQITTQGSLFDVDSETKAIDATLPDATVTLYPHALTLAEADGLFVRLQNEIPWRQDVLRIAGREINIPRLQCLLGDESLPYSYSGISLNPIAFSPALDELRERLSLLGGIEFNAALANLYRNGRDSVDWHSDDERSLGNNPTIASVSLGETRCFELRHRFNKSLPIHKILLPHGSVLLMSGSTQRYWEHRLPKDAKATSPRINLTFRRLIQC